MTDSARRTTKRMRLGTRSCAECRRRKVRCIFRDNETVCNECKVRGIACKSQQAASVEGQPEDGSTQAELLQRLKAVEDYIAHAHSTHEIGSSAVSPESGISDAARTQISSLSGSPALQLDAPLLKMLKDALVIEPRSPPDCPRYVETGSTKSVFLPQTSILPDTNLLVSMLEATEQYWFLWPVPLAKRGQQQAIEAARTIEEAMWSGQAVSVSKALLWLTLCVQQLVGEHRQLLKVFKESQGTLSGIYLFQAIKNLSDDLDQSDYRDGLDCYMLLMKVYINLGRPNKAWQAVRRAINLSLLLGLDRSGTADMEGRMLFQAAWQYDRNLSSLLGLPPSVPESDACLLAENLPDIWQFRILRELSIVAGHITARDRAPRTENDFLTDKIERELESISAEIPRDAWLEALPDGLSFEQYSMQFQIEVYLHSFLKALHIPFAMNSSQDPRDLRSRDVAMQAARYICKSYQIMRQKTQGLLMMCDLADFQVFTGAATLVIGLLRPVGGPTVMNETEDWLLIESVTSLMRGGSKLVDCTVAGQAAELLECLSLARHGLLPDGEGFCATIPYFGRFRIRQGRRSEHNGTEEVTTSEPVRAQAQNSAWNSIEFDAYNSMISAEPIFDVDYGADWLTGIEIDNDFDWTAVF